MNRKRLLTAAIGALLAVAIAGGVAYATIPGPGEVYSACMLKGVGTIRLIDKSLPTTNLMSRCTDKETEVSWNQKGEQGIQGPKGDKGDRGDPGTPGADGADGVGVTGAALSVGDTNCPSGGSKFTAANGVTYACNGTDGSGSSEPGVRTVAGRVAADARVILGTGFSVSQGAVVGMYRISFAAGTWSGCPGPVGTVTVSGTAAAVSTILFTECRTDGSGSMMVQITESGSNLGADRQFDFIAVEP